jgi:hypothetical protein
MTWNNDNILRSEAFMEETTRPSGMFQCADHY